VSSPDGDAKGRGVSLFCYPQICLELQKKGGSSPEVHRGVCAGVDGDGNCQGVSIQVSTPNLGELQQKGPNRFEVLFHVRRAFAPAFFRLIPERSEALGVFHEEVPICAGTIHSH
jgi:hypothetical protein